MGWVAEVGVPGGHSASLRELGARLPRMPLFLSSWRWGWGWGAFCPLALVARLPWIQVCPGIFSMGIAQFSSRAPANFVPWAWVMEVRRPVEWEVGAGALQFGEGCVAEEGLGTWSGM